jgi:hypothetical protein
MRRRLIRFVMFQVLSIGGAVVGMLIDLSYRTGWKAPDMNNMGKIIGGDPIGAAIGYGVGVLIGALMLVFMDRRHAVGESRDDVK